MENTKPVILIVDDEKNTRQGIRLAFKASGYQSLEAENGAKALEILNSSERIDLVISDIRMPQMGGMDLLKKVSAKFPATKVILLTAYGSIDMAVKAMQEGAFDFITKPVNLDKLVLVAKRALETKELEEENKKLHKKLSDRFSCPGIVGQSAQIRRMMEMIHQVAASRATVLIQGESGTGKELVARAIHQLSDDPNTPFVPVHCAALSENLLESELFGHEKGAFTGAVDRKIGRFEMADGGTLFLDEIGEINPAIQAKLLRVLQFKEFERVGGTKTIRVQVRVITATNAILSDEVAKGKFREDLFYRLNIIVIDVPPLRTRKDDIPLLVDAFLAEHNHTHGKNIEGIDKDALSMLVEFDWPGNVRQLKNTLERAVIFCRNKTIATADLTGLLVSPGDSMSAVKGTLAAGAKKDLSVKNNERELIIKAMNDTDGNVTQAAKLLGMSRRTLHRKLNKLEIG